jgi:multidrug efflux pump subunit AcrA (membrane-fusion protein)
VTRVVHEADIQKNTLQVKVAIEAPAPEIKPEMLARVKFLPVERADQPVSPTAEQIFAPEALLHRHAPVAAHAWIVDRARGTAERRNVTLGTARTDGWIEVIHGLHPGDRLIADDPTHLREGQRVRVVGEQAMIDSRGTQHSAHGTQD